MQKTAYEIKECDWSSDVCSSDLEIYLKAKGRVLDVGCGNGNLLYHLKDEGCAVYGVEPNKKSAKICKERGLNVVCGGIQEANFLDNYFDTIVMSQVIEHVPSPTETLKEVHRILKSNGVVLIYCPNAESYLSKVFGQYWHGWHIPFHFYYFTKKTIKEMAEKTGFKVKKVSVTTPDVFFNVSLKGYIFGKKDGIRAINRGKIFDTKSFRIIISPIIRVLDFLTHNGDCLKIELKKEE